MANSRVFTIFAGVNGTGKSTLFYTLEDNFGVRLNTDELVRSAGKDWKNLNAQLEAVRYVMKTQTDCLENGVSFNRETTIPGRALSRLIQDAKKKKFKIHLYFVNVESVDICKERVKNRVENGGHGVPENIIEEGYRVVNQRVAEILNSCDKAQFYDNTFDTIQLVGYKHKDSIVKVVDNCKWLNELDDIYDKIKNPSLFNLGDFDLI